MKLELYKPNAAGEFVVRLIPENEDDKKMLLFQASNIHGGIGTKLCVLAACPQHEKILKEATNA